MKIVLLDSVVKVICTMSNNLKASFTIRTTLEISGVCIKGGELKHKKVKEPR